MDGISFLPILDLATVQASDLASGLFSDAAPGTARRVDFAEEREDDDEVQVKARRHAVFVANGWSRAVVMDARESGSDMTPEVLWTQSGPYSLLCLI